MTAGSAPDWRRAIVLIHRWLGIACGLLVLVWFLSGIVTMYARMPSLDPADRLRRLPLLDLSSARVAPAVAAEAAGLHAGAVDRARIGMIGERPVYRLLAAGVWSTVFADDGGVLRRTDPEAALAIARGLYREHERTLRHEGVLEAPDQWTLQSRAFLPLHRIALGDALGTRIYVSDRSGEVVLAADRPARRWAYAGAVPHWLYFTAFRRHGAVWLRAMIVLSILGCVLTLTGLVWGVWQALARSGARGRSPYSGLLRWHHYTGLVFGLFAFTWMLSGLLSLDPWDWHGGTEPTAPQRESVRGGPPRLDDLDVDRLRAAHAALARSFAPKEIELVRFRGEPYLVAYRTPGPAAAPSRRPTSYEPSSFLSPALPFEHRVVSVLHPERGPFEAFDDSSLLAAAREAMPTSRLADSQWLEEYDAYYYDRDGALSLPVLRARFEDPARTWLYLDPRLGSIVRREVARTRVNRWLYRGLHRLDFPFLHRRRPLWDVVTIVLCLGGAALAATSAADGWRRVARHARRLVKGNVG